MTDKNDPGYTRLDACRRFVESVRHSRELGIEVLDAVEERVTARMPWDEKLVGNPETGVLHGGAVFAFLDQVGGLANACRVFPDFEITPTIDLRIDHLHAPAPGKAVLGRAECYRLSPHVAFVRLEAFEEGVEDDPIAMGLATYMRMKIPREQMKGYKRVG
ncbi:MAG: PaaI family thioesterase [Alcanivoracaceae bacterium]|nr:PaaI family thioesterase [Alcanivoracaceae bacterium]